MSTLTPTARVILGLLAYKARTGYDIKQVTDRSTKFFWGASYGQIYPELRRLEEAGLVRSREAPRGEVRRRLYSVTPKGRKALADWLSEPYSHYDIRDEGLLRLFFADLLPPERVPELLRRRREWYEESAALFRRLGEELGPIDDADPSGHVLRYGIELMDWNAAWWGDLERRLS